MVDDSGDPSQPPTAEEIQDLRRLAAGIIRTQGNRFIKELMRANDVTLGANKDDFERNLIAAIEDGQLRLSDVEGWLSEVEGWGNQHVYLYALPSAVTSDLTESKLRGAAVSAGYEDRWNAPTVLAFPDQPELTSISYTDNILRLVWQEASPGWTPVPDRNYIEEEGLDIYEYRAYRLVERRAITRFEAHKDLGLAALFIADPVQGEEHKQAIVEAKRVIQQLINLPALETNQLDISVLSRNIDQRNVPTGANPTPNIKTQKARLLSGGSYVEFAANSKDRGYAEEDTIRNVRASIRTAQLPAFEGATGVFWIQPREGGLTRALRVQLYGADDRMRLWAQMDVDEVWYILQQVSAFRDAP